MRKRYYMIVDSFELRDKEIAGYLVTKLFDSPEEAKEWLKTNNQDNPDVDITNYIAEVFLMEKSVDCENWTNLNA